MKSYKDYMLFDKLPQTWCAGCSHGIVLQSIAAVMAELEVDKHDMALVSGIGCFGRVDDYLDINCMHVTHGRALCGRKPGFAPWQSEPQMSLSPWVTATARPSAATLIHAARRNINVTGHHFQ